MVDSPLQNVEPKIKLSGNFKVVTIPKYFLSVTCKSLAVISRGGHRAQLEPEGGTTLVVTLSAAVSTLTDLGCYSRRPKENP